MFQADFTIEELKGRREALCDAIGEAVAVVVGCDAPKELRDFRQYNDFYYLCGVEVPHAYLLIDGRARTTTLFLPRESLVDRDHDGPVLNADIPDAAVEATGVDRACAIEDLQPVLQRSPVVYAHLQEGEGWGATPGSVASANRKAVADPWDGRPNRGSHFCGLLRSRNPAIEIRNLEPILKAMRLVKSPSEIALCRRAGQMTARGLCDAMRATRPGVTEYQLDAILRYHYIAAGARGTGYHAIVAGGINAWHGHYNLNADVLKDGDLVLVDCGPDYHYYTSDITRIWPVNGTYTLAQRVLYGFVTEYHKTLLAGIRPARTCEEIETEAVEIMRDRVDEFNFASSVHAAGAEWMFDFCGKHLSHSVGMSVHDGGGHKAEPLKPGIVFSVDPQMRIPEERLYLRVEDTVVVTEDGVDVLTKDVPLELDEIEAMMQEEGMLQSFPPLA